MASSVETWPPSRVAFTLVSPSREPWYGSALAVWLEVLQKILGHSSIRTTIDSYAHLSPRYMRESFGRFADALSNDRGLASW